MSKVEYNFIIVQNVAPPAFVINETRLTLESFTYKLSYQKCIHLWG